MNTDSTTTEPMSGPVLVPRNTVVLRPPHMTWALLSAILVYFAMTWIAGGPDDIAVVLAFGANYGPLVKDGDIWRLVTSVFLHGGVLHLLLNGYALYFLGRNLEAFYGPWALFVFFLGSGVAGALASAVFSSNISVGASGGIFGLLGASLVFAFKHRVILPRRVTTVMGTALIPWVVLNLVSGYFVPVVDMNAHWGGLIAGALLGFAIPPVALQEARGLPAHQAPPLLASLCLSFFIVSFAAAGRNIFMMRGENGALLDPRVATGLPDLNRREILDQINEAIRRNPDDASLLSMRAQLQTASGNWIEAIQDYQRVLVLNPNDANSLNNLAWVLLEEAPDELRNRTEAERLAEKAVSLDPENSYALGTYGTVLLRRGQPREAIGYLERALTHQRPENDEATDRYLLAVALARSGSFEKAESVLNQALREDPENRYRPEAEEAVRSIREPSGDSL
jgi:rhomboid protease GluP